MKQKHSAAAYTKYLVLAAAAIFFVLGILRAEQLEVLQKAVTVCLECIGLG